MDALGKAGGVPASLDRHCPPASATTTYKRKSSTGWMWLVLTESTGLGATRVRREPLTAAVALVALDAAFFFAAFTLTLRSCEFDNPVLSDQEACTVYLPFLA